MKRYRRTDGHSYALGTFCVLELLRRRPAQALRVVLDPAAVDSTGGRLVVDAAAAAGVSVDIDARVPAALARKGNVHAVAAFEKFHDLPDPAADHVVLVRPADFGNLGTIVRTMAGLGASDLWMVPPAADLWDPQVVRASMGTVFGLRSAVVADLATYAAGSTHRLYLFGAGPMFAGGPLARLDAIALSRPAALVFGPESSGLLATDLPAGLDGLRPPGQHDQPGATAVAIPQDPAVDSYNLAVAVALGLWEFRRQTGGLPGR